jgi:glc operon protein GlcG
MRDKPCLTEADLIKAMAACRAEADKNNWKVAIAIVDDGGYLLHFNRMEGVAPISAEVAIGKARTAAMTRRPSKFFEDRVKERPATNAWARSESPASPRTRTSRSPRLAQPR